MLGIGQIGSAIGRIGATTPNKGVPNALLLNGRRISLNSQPVTLTKAA